MKRPCRLLTPLFALGLAGLLGACSEDSPTGPTPGGSTVNEATSFHAGVEFTVSTPQNAYDQDESIPVTFRIENKKETAVSYQFNSTRQHDVQVEEDDATVWNWSNGRSFGRSFTTLNLEPGENVEWTETWDQRGNDGELVDPGSFEILGVLPVYLDAQESAAIVVRIES